MISLAGQHCVVVGGAGAVGRLFVDRLRRSGAEVYAVDTAVCPPDDTGARPGIEQGDITNIGPKLAAELGRADLVLLAVPEKVAMVAIKPVADALHPGALLVDTLSVKGQIVSAVRAYTTGFEVLSLNPMFAPELGFEGRPVAAIVVHDGPRVQTLLRLIEIWGGQVVLLTMDEHDRLAGATQALTHATILAFGFALAELEIDITDLTAVAPPPHATLLALLARITSSQPAVYWDVQSANPHAGLARKALASAVRRVSELIEDHDESAFATSLSQLRSFLDPEHARYRNACARMFENMTYLDNCGGNHDPGGSGDSAAGQLGEVPH